MTEALDNEIRTLRAHFWSERDPDGRAFVPLADAYLKRGDLDEARALLEDGLGRLPNFASGHLVAARVHRAQGDLEATRKAVARLRELDPDNAAGLRLHGELLEEDGHLQEALRAFERAWNLNPEYDDLEGRISRLEVKVAGGDPSESDGGIEGMVTGADVYADTIEGEGLPEEAELSEEPSEDPVFEISDEPDAGVPPAEPVEDPAFEDMDALEGTPSPDDPDEEDALAADDLDTLAPWAETFEDETEGDEILDVDFEDLDSTEDSATTSDDELESDFGGFDDLDLGSAAQPEEDMGFEEVVEPEEAVEPDPAPVGGAFELEDEVEPVDDAEETTGEAVAEDPSPTVTRTLGELYFRQGLAGRAVEVFEELVRRDPENEALRARLREIREGDQEGADASEARPEAGDEPEDRPLDEPEPPAGDLEDEASEKPPERSTAWADEADDEAGEDLHTPFAWDAGEEDDPGPEATDRPEEEAPAPSRTIGRYLNDLRAWVPGAVPVESLDPAAVPIESLAPHLEVEPSDEAEGDLDDFQEWLKGLRS